MERKKRTNKFQKTQTVNWKKKRIFGWLVVCCFFFFCNFVYCVFWLAFLHLCCLIRISQSVRHSTDPALGHGTVKKKFCFSFFFLRLLHQVLLLLRLLLPLFLLLRLLVLLHLLLRLILYFFFFPSLSFRLLSRSSSFCFFPPYASVSLGNWSSVTAGFFCGTFFLKKLALLLIDFAFYFLIYLFFPKTETSPVGTMSVPKSYFADLPETEQEVIE